MLLLWLNLKHISKMFFFVCDTLHGDEKKDLYAAAKSLVYEVRHAAVTTTPSSTRFFKAIILEVVSLCHAYFGICC